jgi:leader peptidase (prepilin peptidase)/N-methyltransferase
MYPNGGGGTTQRNHESVVGGAAMNSFVIAAWAGYGLLIAPSLTLSTRWLAHSSPNGPALIAVSAPLTAAAFALSAQRVSVLPELLATSIFAAVAVQLAVIDVVERRLPRALIWPMCIAVVGVYAIWVVVEGDEAYRIIRAAVGSVALASFYLVIACATRGGLGPGDVRLAVPIGFMLGWHGWSAVAAGTMLGLVGTSLIAAMTLVRRRHVAIPHGPGMLAGAFVVMLG